MKSNAELASDIIEKFRVTEYDTQSAGILDLARMITEALDEKDRLTKRIVALVRQAI